MGILLNPFFILFSILLAAINTVCAADTVTHVERDGVTHTIFKHAATQGRMNYVTNSGICEKTPGVNQYSGYISVGENMNMWFWFFEARNSPSTAPIVAWLNGGPGCSSMIGLFQENGPCQFYNGSSEPSNNTHSFNNYANMLYVDQPIGAGFSYGTVDANSTTNAAPYVWKFLQNFYAQFPKYQSRDFGLFTESYGGHYGPEFAEYIEQQNRDIESGLILGDLVQLIALGINDGYYDSEIQERAYIDYSVGNNWNEIITPSQATQYYQAFQTHVLPAIRQCEQSGSNKDCRNANNLEEQYIDNPLSSAKNFDVYDVREPSNDPYPPSQFVHYLKRPSVTKSIGAEVTWSQCSRAVFSGFNRTGDNSRSLLPALSKVVSSGIPVLIWAGDADWICNWMGNLDVANNVTFPGEKEFRAASLQPYTVNGKEMGQFKSKNNLNFLRVYAAGHEVPYYQPVVASQVFQQILLRRSIFST